MSCPELAYSLMSELGKVQENEHPPVHLWHPNVERDIDLVISRDGVWNYLGSPIKRPRLVRLFASVLRRDGDDYYLVTPVEKCRITVKDVPFQVVLMNVTGEGISAGTFVILRKCGLNLLFSAWLSLLMLNDCTDEKCRLTDCWVNHLGDLEVGQG